MYKQNRETQVKFYTQVKIYQGFLALELGS